VAMLIRFLRCDFGVAQTCSPDQRLAFLPVSTLATHSLDFFN
jgi:hypothetical protein